MKKDKKKNMSKGKITTEVKSSNIKEKDKKIKKENEENKQKRERKFNIDKEKIFKGIGVGLIVLIVLVLSFLASKSYAIDTESFEFKNITIDEYLTLVADEEANIIYVARPNCSWCQKESPIIKKIGSEYDLTINYLDTSNFTYQTEDGNFAYTEDGLKFVGTSEKYQNEGYGTPNTLIVQNGEIIDGIYQYADASQLKDLFKRNGFINE